MPSTKNTFLCKQNFPLAVLVASPSGKRKICLHRKVFFIEGNIIYSTRGLAIGQGKGACNRQGFVAARRSHHAGGRGQQDPQRPARRRGLRAHAPIHQVFCFFLYLFL